MSYETRRSNESGVKPPHSKDLGVHASLVLWASWAIMAVAAAAEKRRRRWALPPHSIGVRASVPFCTERDALMIRQR